MKSGLTTVTRVLAAIVGVVFIAAALSKAIFPPGYPTVFGHLEHAYPWFAKTVIGIEVILGAWLFVGWHRGIAAILELLLLAIFSGMIVHDMLQHYPDPCGCFGAAWQRAHEPVVIERGLAISLVRNGLMGLGAVLILLIGP